MAFINIRSWTTQEVAEWMKGLNENVGQYIEQFVNQGVTGEKLLRITQQDLQEVEMRKIGHQEIFFECLNLIRSLYYVMENENLQSLALSLSCKANNLKSLIKCNGYCHQYSENSKTLSNDVLALIVDVVMATRTLVSWLDRTPFYGIDYFSNARETVVSQCLQLTEMVHMDSHATDLENAILPLSIEIVELCNKLIKDTKDPLVIQPAHLELVTLKKIKPEEGLGLLIKATYEGEHIITGTKEQSAADLSRKVHQGDEILQVNYRTVVGWQLSKVVEAMKEDPNEVTLTLKKRPKNVSLQGQIIVKRSVLNSSTANVKKKHSHTAPGRRRQSSNEKRLKSPLEQLFIPPPPDEPYSPRTASDETLHSSLTPPDSPNFQLDRQVSFHQTEPDPLLQYHTRRCTVSEVTLRNKSNNILNRTQNSNGRPTSLPADNKELEEIANIEVENWTSIPTDKKTSSNISNVIIESKPSPEILKNDEAIKLSNNVEHTDEKQSNHSNHRLIKTSSCEHMIELNVEISDDLLTDRKNGEVGITQRSSFRIVTDDYTMKKNTPKKDINENTSSKKMCEKPVSDTVDVHSTFKLQDPPKSKIVNSASKDSMKISNGAVDSNVESGIVDGSAGSSVVDTKAGSGVADSSVGSSVVDSSVGSSVVDSSVGSSVVDSSVGSSVVDSSVGSSVVDSSVGSSVVDSSVGSSVVDSNAEKHIEQDNIVSQNVTSLEHKENEQTSDSKTLDSQLGESQVLHMPDPTSSNVSNASMPSRVSECYEVKIIAGVPVKMPIVSCDVKRRKKVAPTKKKVDRRISCKNLGVGECQGWLWKKEERKGFGNKWNKRWFVLKEYSLFYYKERSSLRATGVISLPGYRVSPAAHSETKRQFAFKICHPNVEKEFLFASERSEDMSKWMNALGLASIAYHDVKDNTRMEKKTENRRKFTAVPESPISPTSPASAALYYSESEDDTEDDHQSPISSKSPSAQTTPSQSPVADRLPRIAPSTNSTPSQSPVLDRIPHIVPSTNLTPSHSPVLDRVSRISPSTNSPSQSPVFERSSHISPSMNITPLQSSARQSTSSNSPWTGRSSATSLATSSTSAKEDQKKSDSEAEDIIDFFETINNIEIQGITSSRRQTMSGRERLKSYSRRHQNPHKNEKLLKKDALERTLKAKECELEEIEKLLHGSATKESLKHWKDSHPEYCGKHKDVKKKQKDLKSKNSSKKTPSPEKKRKSRAKDGKKSTKEDESEKGSDIDYHETHL